jgi:hypothetical protein
VDLLLLRFGFMKKKERKEKEKGTELTLCFDFSILFCFTYIPLSSFFASSIPAGIETKVRTPSSFHI